MAGASASKEAIAACEAKEIDIKAHKSKAISQQIIQENDFIFVMEQMHYNRIIALCPEAESKCMLLAENQDIADPIGQRQEFFNNCLELIEKAVKKRVDELVIHST
jgi:protein-tyrosine-phosphatase